MIHRPRPRPASPLERRRSRPSSTTRPGPAPARPMPALWRRLAAAVSVAALAVGGLGLAAVAAQQPPVGAGPLAGFSLVATPSQYRVASLEDGAEITLPDADANYRFPGPHRAGPAGREREPGAVGRQVGVSQDRELPAVLAVRRSSRRGRPETRWRAVARGRLRAASLGVLAASTRRRAAGDSGGLLQRGRARSRRAAGAGADRSRRGMAGRFAAAELGGAAPARSLLHGQWWNRVRQRHVPGAFRAGRAVADRYLDRIESGEHQHRRGDALRGFVRSRLGRGEPVSSAAGGHSP